MNREKYLAEIALQFRVHEVCAILGPCQVGKTTLVKMYVEKHFINNAYFFDLGNPVDLKRLENPMLALQSISQELIVINEIQLRPNLFPILRVLIDATRVPLGEKVSDEIRKKQKKYLILGSASQDLIRKSSARLIGRIGYIELSSYDVMQKLWSSN